MSVLALLLAVAVPSLQAAQAAMQIHSAPFTAASKIGEARTQALRQNRQVWVVANGPLRSLQVQAAGPSGPVNIGGPEFLPANVTLNLGAALTATITFDSMGRPLTPPQTLQLQHAITGVTRTITVAATGRITVN